VQKSKLPYGEMDPVRKIEVSNLWEEAMMMIIIIIIGTQRKE
jgi:hypothetical protein